MTYDAPAPAEFGQAVAMAQRRVTAAGSPALRSVLREETGPVHRRLHAHDGFAAIQDATISLADYRRLIVRLYGFYGPFEAAAGVGSERSHWLAADLDALGLAGARDAVAQCPDLPRLDTPWRRLGALYVVEGSALGGRELARGLDGLFGPDAIPGRRFFIGRGSGTGEAWRLYLAQLAAAPSDPATRAEIVEAAFAVFAAFEHWLSGWRTASHG